MTFNLSELLRQSKKEQAKIQHQWPDPEKKLKKSDVTKKQLDEFKNLIRSKSSETEIHNFLEKNEVIFAYALKDFRTGHHGLWVYSKQEIQPKIKHRGIKGMIPDFIIGGENSDGHQWFVIELKGADDKVFSHSGNSIQLSSVANKGICQLMEYTDSCCEIQSHLRDHFRMHEFREPKGILIIGTEEEFRDKRKQRLKKAFNQNFNKNFEIRTYDWLFRGFEE